MWGFYFYLMNLKKVGIVKIHFQVCYSFPVFVVVVGDVGKGVGVILMNLKR